MVREAVTSPNTQDLLLVARKLMWHPSCEVTGTSSPADAMDGWRFCGSLRSATLAAIVA
jgi:hypothetical protein